MDGVVATALSLRRPCISWYFPASRLLTVSSSSCILLGMAVGWASWESRPWIHQLGQGALPSSSEASRWHLTGLQALTDLGGPGLWAN